MPASSSQADRSRRRRTTESPSIATPVGNASSRTGASSGASRAKRPSAASVSSTTFVPNGDSPWSTSAKGTTRLRSSRSWTSNSTNQSSGPTGSCTRRHTRTRPPTTVADLTHVSTTAARARTLAGSSDGGNHGSADTNDRIQASANVGRPGRRRIRATFSAANWSRTMPSTASASRDAARRCASADRSGTNPATRARSCDAAGVGHHHERLRPSPSTARPGRTRPLVTSALATRATVSSAGSAVGDFGRAWATADHHGSVALRRCAVWTSARRGTQRSGR